MRRRQTYEVGDVRYFTRPDEREVKSEKGEVDAESAGERKMKATWRAQAETYSTGTLERLTSKVASDEQRGKRERETEGKTDKW